MLVGSSHVLQLAEMMGGALARRISDADATAHIIGEFGEVRIATAAGTPLHGKTLAGTCASMQVNVIGLWRGQFEVATTDTKIDAHSVLILAGSEQQLRSYNELVLHRQRHLRRRSHGGGRVGRATLAR